MAVFSPFIRTFVIMADTFPEALVRYSVNELPHAVINGRVHVEGIVDDKELLQHIAAAVRGQAGPAGPARE
jgi:hypothetical protein